MMRAAVTLQPAALEMTQSGTSGSAFTVSFDYDQPDVALKVADEFIREILNQDSNRRANDATEITKFLEQDVRRLQQEHNAVIAQIEALKQRPPSTTQAISEETKTNMKLLAELEAELIQKSTVYSDEYPVVKDLKRKIAALKRTIASTPRAAAAATDSDSDQTGVAAEVLRVQAISLQSNLDEATRKLAAARLGESMEKNREAEHLQLIRQPELPHKPFESKKLKYFAMGLAMAGMIGAGSIFAAETLNGGIRRSQEVFGIVDRNLIVTVPYLFLPGEKYRKRRNLILALVTAVLLAILAMALIYAISKGIVSVDMQSWIGMLMPRH
jgi:protein tyrosine kinase modulator